VRAQDPKALENAIRGALNFAGPTLIEIIDKDFLAASTSGSPI
jgi:hypothetical protein